MKRATKRCLAHDLGRRVYADIIALDRDRPGTIASLALEVQS